MKRVLAVLAAVMILTAFFGAAVHAVEASDGKVPKSEARESGDAKSKTSEDILSLPSGSASGEIGRAIEDFVDEHKDTMAGMAVPVFERSNILCEGYFGFTDREAHSFVHAGIYGLFSDVEDMDHIDGYAVCRRHWMKKRFL